MLLGLRGTPFLYYGEEIGMGDVAIPEHMLQDPARIHTEGRDPERTPMQWEATDGRGFTTGTPWLPFGHETISVAAQVGEADSMLSLYRRALRFRKSSAALRRGKLELLDLGEELVAFLRTVEGEPPLVVAVNTSLQPRTIALPSGVNEVVLATDLAMEGACATPFVLPPLGAAYFS